MPVHDELPLPQPHLLQILFGIFEGWRRGGGPKALLQRISDEGIQLGAPQPCSLVLRMGRVGMDMNCLSKPHFNWSCRKYTKQHFNATRRTLKPEDSRLAMALTTCSACRCSLVFLLRLHFFNLHR